MWHGVSATQGAFLAPPDATLRITPTFAMHDPVIRCHLPGLMQQHRLRISDVARATGLNRSTITSLCRQRATRIELPALDRLCTLFQCHVGDLLEQVADPKELEV